MSLFDTLIVQPIFNLLMFIYALLPGNDFGIALIVFAILVRLLMWPLIKKQLHQTKVMRAIQPELKKIKAKAKGNRQLEGQLMLELYRERGVNPFSSFGVLLIQLPIFIALFQVVQIITTRRNDIASYTYGFIEQLNPVRAIVDNPQGFNESLLNFLDLTAQAISQSGISIPLVILALLSAVLQYIQSKQITPQPTENKKLRDIFRASAEGKQVDQSEVSAIMMSRMLVFFPILAFLVALYLPGALVLFYAVSSLVAVVQQHYILKEDVEDMEALVDKTATSKKKPIKKAVKTNTATSGGVGASGETKVRVLKSGEAEVVSAAPSKKSRKRKKR